MSTSFDFVIIGAGPAGEAAAYKARELGATVAIVDRRWFGGSCPHIGCLPSKSLLHGAYEHRENPAAYDWPRASARRDYMVNRAPDAAEPDDGGHVSALEKIGAVVHRGDARITGPGRVAVRRGDTTHELVATHVVVAVGSHSRRVDIPGMAEVRPWTNEEATLARELPGSMLVLGGGPTGCELAQVYARFGVPTTIVQSGPRRADRPPAQLRGDPRDARGRRRDGAEPALARSQRTQEPVRMAGTSSTSTMARPPKGTW